MLIRVLVLLLSLFSAEQASAVTLMSETFEGDCATVRARWPARSGGMENWPCTHPMTLNTNPAFVRSGSQSLRLQYDGGENYGGYVDQIWPNKTYSEIWVTYDTYMVAPFYTGGDTAHGVGGIGTKGLYTFMYSAAQGRYWGWVPNWIWGGKQHTLGTQGCYQNDNGIPYDSTFFYQNQTGYHQQENVWVRHEVHYKLNTPGSADGVLEEYQTVAGGTRTLTTRYTNRTCLDATTGGQMPSDAKWAMMRIYRQYGLGVMYIDNLTVTTEAVVAGGGDPPPPDTTPPPVPSAPTVPTTNLPATYQWSAVTDPGDLAGYNVYRKLEACSGGGSTSLIAVLGNVLIHQDTTIPSNTTAICVKVASRDTTGNVSAQSTGTDESLTPPATSTSLVNTLASDATGTDMTFVGAAYKIRYWHDFTAPGVKVEVSGLGGVTSYRHNITFAPGTTYICYEAQGSNGVWQTDTDPNSYGCIGVTPGTGDSTAPSIPTGIEVR